MQVKIEDGKISSTTTSNSWDNFDEFSEFVIINNDNEYTWTFIEQNMVVLVAHFQKTIEDIVEAYIFKELNEAAY